MRDTKTEIGQLIKRSLKPDPTPPESIVADTKMATLAIVAMVAIVALVGVVGVVGMVFVVAITRSAL